MITDLFYNYINELNSSNEELIVYYNEILNFENSHIIPAVRMETAFFLNWISLMHNPENILEIGFGSGASSLFIHKDLGNIKKFISLERDNNRFQRGINILNKYEIENIQLIRIDAFQFLKNNMIKFDLIFLDAVKRDYYDFLQPLKKILNPNGLLICDNILFNGKVIEKNIEERYRDGTALLKRFNEELMRDADLLTNFLLIGDGLSVSFKKNNTEKRHL